MDNFPQDSPQGNSSQILVKPEITLARIRDGGACGLSCPIKKMYTYMWAEGMKCRVLHFEIFMGFINRKYLFINDCVF